MTLSPSRCVALAAALLCAACAPAARTPVAPPPAAPALAPARQAAPAPARQAGPAPTSAMGFDLSVRNLMRGEGLVGRSPNELRWSPDSRWVYFRWRSSEAKDTTTSLYRVAAAGGAPEPLPDSVSDWTAPAQGEDGWSLDGTARVFERRGDIFVAWTNGTERRITDTPARERAPQLSPDGRTVYFLSGNNLFAVELAGGTLRQLTDVRTEDAPKPDSAKGHRRFLEEEQRRLFGVVRDRVAEREHRERQDSLRTRVRPLYLGRNAALGTAQVSPSGRHLLLTVTTRPQGEKQTLVPSFVTESGYTEPLTVRTKVGDAQETRRVGVLELATARVAWVEPEPKDRRQALVVLGWAPRADRALVMGISDDFTDRWLYEVGTDGRARVVDHLRDEAWVAGPAFGAAGWLDDGRVWFVSERSGYAHLYTAAAGRTTALTAGQWEVTDVELSPDRGTFYLATSETHPGERNLYALPAGGGARTRLTALDGWTTGDVSPDGRWIALLHATGNTPPELYLMPNAPGAPARRVTESTTAEFRRGPWVRPEVVTFTARDGARVHARIYRPRDLGAQPHGGAVLFVHGAGYLQNAHRGWSTYYREYLFHHLLASRGYTVLDVDYRGSAGYGAAWRTGIYRHMGGKDLTDHVDAARWLVATERVDPKRIGIYGGSYGGFITLMAMFTEPEVFRAGAALRSVTDWAHYNHPYTARILNLPHDDTLAYRRSSPIYYAEGLRGDLLIAHGMVDVNVHFQDVVRLAQRLIELGKTNWEMAVYPVEDHAFTRPESWADEYRRILELFERTLRPDSPPLPAANPAPGR